MKFNALKFYSDFHVDHCDSGHKRTRDGWVQIHCPFCIGSKGYHLGFHIGTGAYSCWRCGKHSQVDVVKQLLNCNVSEAFKTIKDYSGIGNRGKTPSRSNAVEPKRKKESTFPEGTADLTERHKNYLIKRKYDPEELVRLWNLKGTLAGGRYKWRIIAPIMFDGKFASYQGRDITNKSELKYKACEKAEEMYEHQKIVYGLDFVKGDACVIVEGIADVWRLGYGAICCFGTAFTISQVNLIAERMKTVYILFDSDESNAIKMANKLACMLSGRGLEVEVLELAEGDPGDMPQAEANKLMKELNLWTK
jgi:hypothetical protein